MKSLFILALLSVFVIAVTCLPEPAEAEDTDRPTFPWFNTYSYQYMMCRLRCKQSCLEQGYWRGACKQGACYCFGPMGPVGPMGPNARMTEFPMMF